MDAWVDAAEVEVMASPHKDVTLIPELRMARATALLHCIRT